MSMPPSFGRHRRQRGLSLIELMVAILIGSILVLGLSQVFSASRAAYQLAQGVARSQESARFALDFMTHDLRLAGHAGCVNDQSLLTSNGTQVTGGNIRSLFLDQDQRNANAVDDLPLPLRFDLAIQGFEAKGTGPGSSVTLPATPVVGAAGGWIPELPDVLADRNPVAGSDIIMLRYFSSEEAQVNALTLGAASTIGYPAASAEVATGGAGLYALADCGSATVFQASAAPTTTSMTVSVSGLNKSGFDFVGTQDGALSYKVGGASLYRAESVAYFVGLSNGVPSLMRARWTSAPGAEGLNPVNVEPLVEGVESMQLLYGEDSQPDPELPPSGYINTANTAAVIGGTEAAARWRRVGAVQLGLLVRSTERSAVGQSAVPPQVLQVELTPPNDGNYRSSYETTVALRNRLFGN